jgi:lantibiotic modifying enzyme
MTKKIQVGKKQAPAPVPVPKPVSQRNIFSKILEVLKEDQVKSSRNIRAIISETDPGWYEYRRFIEISKGSIRNGEKE